MSLFFRKAIRGNVVGRRCWLPGCDETARAWGTLDGERRFLCNAHERRTKKHGDPHALLVPKRGDR